MGGLFKRGIFDPHYRYRLKDLHMKIAIIVAIVLIPLILLLGAPKTQEHIEQNEPIIEHTVQVEEVTVEEPVAAPVSEIKEEVDIVKENPKNCVHETEWILPDGSCKLKDTPLEQKEDQNPKPAIVSGDWVERCHNWAAQAGITLDSAAIKLLERESKCDPTICNPNGVACGIPQALPYTKMGCGDEKVPGLNKITGHNPVCQLQWFKNYVTQRYGSYSVALAHSYANNWY